MLMPIYGSSPFGSSPVGTTAFNVWALCVGRAGSAFGKIVVLVPEPIGLSSVCVGGTAVATDPIESTEHGKFCNLSTPFVSGHLNISADAIGAHSKNARKILPGLLIL
jgi:hypothetical protein